MKKPIAFIIMLILIVNNIEAQTKIKMLQKGGVSILPCKINGLDLNFIFDTGASDVSLSITEALFMFKNGYLNEEDILEKSNYSDASGNIGVNTIVNIKEIIIAGIKLTNVKAGIVDKLSAPLLLGQTAIRKLGVIQLDFEQNVLTILNGKANPEDNVVVAKFKIGQEFDGGKIFYIDEMGEHGLIAALEDQFRGEIFWQDGIERSSGAINMSIGYGNSNTEKIIVKNVKENYPAKICYDLKLNGYEDWYLPSLKELEELYKQRDIIGGFQNYYYWSSSEMDKEKSWVKAFINEGKNIPCAKNYNPLSAVRAIRSF